MSPPERRSAPLAGRRWQAERERPLLWRRQAVAALACDEGASSLLDRRLDDRQRDHRRTILVVVDGLIGDLDLGVLAERMPRVRVAIPHRRTAARDLQPDLMPRLEEIARRPDFDRVLVDLAGRDQRRIALRFPIARALDAVR